MKNILAELYDLIRPALPVFMLLLGGIGVIYSIGTGRSNSSLMILSLILLIVGISIYTYQQAISSEFFKKRFGQKAGKSKDRQRKRSGKRCPECSKIIYHRRTVCRHCGYKFPSYKETPDEAEQSSGESSSS